MENIKITKKNSDGSYDYGDYLFEAIDLYGGDHVFRTLELSPASPEKTPKYVKLSISTKKDGISYTFKPIKEGSHLLINEQYPGLKFYVEDKIGSTYTPDKNGIVVVTNLLIQPQDITVHLVADQYSISDFNSEEVIDDISIELWSL